MSYIVVVDSCGELTKEMKESGRFFTAPLTLQIGSHTIVDDETFDQRSFLKEMMASPQCPRSACPSPETYRALFERDVDHVYAVTLSAELSGSYNSALLGKALCLEEHPTKRIYVFNSRSASIGETLIAMKIQECEEKGLSFEQVITQVEAYIDSQTTWFVLESLENLRKNGRLSNLKARVASALNIKPVMTSTPEGNVAQLCQCRGINKALVRMVENIVEVTKDSKDKILAISHCNNRQKALMVKDALLERMPLRDVLVMDTRGVSSLYADNGGIIVVV